MQKLVHHHTIVQVAARAHVIVTATCTDEVAQLSEKPPALLPLLAGVWRGGTWQAGCCPRAPPFPRSCFRGLVLLPLVGMPPDTWVGPTLSPLTGSPD